MKLKAQITMEYIVLFSISLVVLSISLALIYSINSISNKVSKQIYFSNEVSELSGKIISVCSLGSENKRYFLLDSPLNISYYDAGIKFSRGNISIVKEYLCSVYGDPNFQGNVKIENVDGAIYLSNSFLDSD